MFHMKSYTLLIPSCPPIEHFLCPHCCKLKIFHSNCFDHAPRNAGSLGGHFKMAAGLLSWHHSLADKDQNYGKLTISWDNSILPSYCSLKASKYVSVCWRRSNFLWAPANRFFFEFCINLYCS
jgi:hypothetical protein